MSKFTPGPYVVIEGDTYYGVSMGSHIRNRNAYRSVHRWIVNVQHDDEEALATATLMADAPALLDALESLLNSIPSLTCGSFHHARKDQHNFDDECPPFERYLAEAIKARALIAKHRGNHHGS